LEVIALLYLSPRVMREYSVGPLRKQMIQAPTIKPIEQKATHRSQSSSASEAKSKAKDVESKLEGDDFANELEAASLNGEEPNLKVKAVEVSPEQLMTPAQIDGSSEGVKPEVFDPSLTKSVDQIIQPKTTAVEGEAPVIAGAAVATELTAEQLAQIAEGKPVNAEMDAEIAQAMLKTPQVQTGRAPAIDLAKGEVDPQLLNMEDFVAQKNLAVKKSLNNTSAYGMPAKAQSGKAGADTGLNSTQTVNQLGENGSSAMNSQQFILNAQVDMGANAKANEAQAVVKTFNMSDVKTDNPNQIMTQITDYIVQAKAAKEPTVNMRVNHEELGMIDITVNKMGGVQDAIAINIGTHSIDGKNFFQTNSKDLFSHLTNSGLNVSEVKVETPSQTAKNDFDFNGQSGKGTAGQEKQFGSEQNQRRHESDRRKDLWDLLNKEAA
jgi:hypothetical protein